MIFTFPTPSRSFRIVTLQLSLAAFFSLYISSMAWAVILQQPGIRDHLFDSSRQLLYISTDAGDLLRYDLQSMSFLSPLDVGGSLRGMEITADSQFLYIADHTSPGSQSFVRKVNLGTLDIVSLAFGNETNERGTEDVKIASNGIALLTSGFDGTSQVPLHQIDTSTDIITRRLDAPGSFNRINDSSHLHRSADRSTILILQGSSSDGRLALYHSSTNSIGTPVNGGGLIDQSEAGISRDGSIVAHAGVYNGGPIHIRDSALIEQYTIPTTSSVPGLTFDPIQDVLYYADADLDKIVAYDVINRTQLRTFDVGANVDGSGFDFSDGNLKISPDGQWLALSLEGPGIPAGAISLIQIVPEPTTLLILAALVVASLPSFLRPRRS